MALKDKLKEALNDEVEVDFSGASEGGDFAPIPIGDYELLVEASASSTSKAGNPTVKVQFKVDQKDSAHNGRVFFRHCPTKGKGSGILRDTARALGEDVDDKAKKFKPSSLIGKRAIGTIGFQKGSDEYQEIKKLKAIPAKGAGRSTTRAGSKLR
jgi:hypothetical protein